MNEARDEPINPSARAALPPHARASVYRLFVDALEREEDLREQFRARECHDDPQSRADIEDPLRLAINDETAGLLKYATGISRSLIGTLQRVGRPPRRAGTANLFSDRLSNKSLFHMVKFSANDGLNGLEA